MKVLYCASEVRPFAASGGLGDVAGSLPKALCREGIDCRVVMPLYSTISQELRNNMRYIKNITVNVSWKREYCGIFESELDGVKYYFIDNERYFKRPNLYGFYDDGERFTFFSRACLEILPHIDFHPDILHCNDWQTALIPVYYYAFYSKNEWYYNIKSIFTIHNIAYQGNYNWIINYECVGLPDEYKYLLEFGGQPNFMKAGIQCSTRITTVSPTYANEIKDDWFAHGLAPTIRDFEGKLCGILNGIDFDSFNPETDKNLYKNYNANDISGKYECKRMLQERLNLEQNSDIPLVAMVSRLVSHKGIDLVRDGIEYLLDTENMQFVVLGSGEHEYESYFAYLQNKYPGRVCACYGYNDELARKIYSGSDIFLMPSKSEPCGLAQMIAMRYGSVPIARKTGGLADSVIDSGGYEGNGFIFDNYNVWDMQNAIKRSIWGYNNRDGWKQLMHRCMTWDYSWAKSARDYINVYNDTFYNWA